MSKLSFTGPVEGWVHNHLRTNFWKVSRSMEFDDALQEARLLYAAVMLKYPDVEDKHFMALFKTSWQRKIVDLAKVDSKVKACTPFSAMCSGEGTDYTFETVGATDNDGALVVMLRNMPADVRAVISVMLHAPSELVEALMGGTGSKRERDRANRRLCSMVGCAPDRDLVGEVKSHFQ